MELLEKELTKKIIGAFYKVYQKLGHGFTESVYEKSMLIQLAEIGLRAESQVGIKVKFKGQIVGDFKADILVEEKVLLELKAVEYIHDRHIAQLLNYLKASQVEVGLLFNFGPEPSFERKVFLNSRK